MKKFYTILCLVIITTTQLKAQAPQGFNYQATVRNSSGDLILNQNVYFKFNIMQGSQTSVPIFNEVHYVPTDDLGQVNLVIGQGTPTTGSFSQIDWSQGSYFLGIELDTGNGYTAMGTTQLLSVPFALYAENAGNGNISNPNLESVLAENNSANSQQIKDLQDPTEAQDAATKAYIDALIANLQTQIENLSSGSNPTNDSGSVSDIDGNSYNYNTYGDFQWTLENAQMVTYRDGTPIPQVTDPNEWSQLTTGAWCYYNNDPTKGMLYNWYAVAGIHDNDPNTPNKELAPDGWQVPTDIEWTSLEEHLIANGYNYDGTTTGNKIAKAMASASGWNFSSNSGAPGNEQSANNSSGFNAFPKGDNSSNGNLFTEGNAAVFWSLTSINTSFAYSYYLEKNNNYLTQNNVQKIFGESVRFVRNLGDSSGNDPVNEQEIITTVEVTLTGTNGIEFVLSWENIDGDGPNVPVVVGASIPAGNYAGDIQLYNKTLNPSDDGYIVTNEILEEDLDHQFFYFAPNGLDAIFTYNDSDSNGNPVGQQFNLTANSGTGEFRLVMIYEPDKTGIGVSDGDITNAGGETDVDIFFPITVEGNIDTTPPVINLIGDSTIELFIGDTYEDTGATAIDDTDGDITSLIIVDASSVNTAVVGTYIVTYNVSDAAGNDANEVSRTINVLPTPTRFNQNVLIEDYTGTWSGYCPRVSHAIDLVNQQTSEAVVVAIHRGSTDPNNSSYDPYNFSAEVLENLINLQGYPTAMLNRTTQWNYPEPNNVNQVIDLTSEPADVGLAISPSLDGDIMSIDVKVKFGGEFSDSEAKLVLYVLEDGLFYDQTNYTNYYGGSSVISNFEHNHVLRASLSNLRGDLIPEDEYSEDNVYQVNYTMAIPSNISVNENMTLVAFVTNEFNAALNVRVANFGETQIFEEL